jgi:hypothetical protein
MGDSGPPFAEWLVLQSNQQRKSIMRNITSLKLFTSVAALGLASLTVACNQPSSTATARVPVPLPTDYFNANPASPNCYPDINHCASYSSGDVTEDKPAPQK